MEIRKSIRVIFSFLMMLLLLAGPVSAEIVKKINDSSSISVFGQVNRAMMYVDDGDQTEVFQVDNDNSSSRIGSKMKVNQDGITAGANLEFEYKSPGSDKIDQDGNDGSKDQFYKRKVEAYLSGSFGMVSMGTGSTASDATSEADLSGTKMAGRSKVASLAGAVKFFDKDSGALSGTTVGKAFSNMDGGLKDRVRYDSPVFYGFQVAATFRKAMDDDVIETAVTYNKTFSDTKVKAALSYVDDQNKDYNQVNGSASILLPMGLNVTVAAGTQDVDGRSDDPTFVYGKVGYIADIFSKGKTAFSLDYGKYNDQAQDGDEGDTMGAQVVQNLKALNTELYLGYRFYSLDRDSGNLDDISGVLAGMRLKF